MAIKGKGKRGKGPTRQWPWAPRFSGSTSRLRRSSRLLFQPSSYSHYFHIQRLLCIFQSSGILLSKRIEFTVSTYMYVGKTLPAHSLTGGEKHFPILTVNYETEKKGGSKFTLVHFASSSTRWTCFPTSATWSRRRTILGNERIGTRCSMNFLRDVWEHCKWFSVSDRLPREREERHRQCTCLILHCCKSWWRNFQSFILRSYKSIRLGGTLRSF